MPMYIVESPSQKTGDSTVGAHIISASIAPIDELTIGTHIVSTAVTPVDMEKMQML